LPRAKFTKKADVFAAGVIFLELISLSSPNTLYQAIWPRIIQESVPLPQALKEILIRSLAGAPEARTGSFDELLMLLRSSEEKVVSEMIDVVDFSIDVSAPAGSGFPSVWLELPETDSLAQKTSSGLEHWGEVRR
jgi:hypothetical protein